MTSAMAAVTMVLAGAVGVWMPGGAPGTLSGGAVPRSPQAAAPSATLVASAASVTSQANSASMTPQAAADALLAADRRFAAASASTDAVTGLTAMFTADVIMPGPPGTLHRGLTQVAASLRANPDNADARVEWTPIGVGLAADGEHGFTFGFMTLRRKDGTTMPLKYMAYWVKGDGGWRVAGYKRARRPEGDVSTALLPPLLPSKLVPANADPARLASLRQELSAAERAFSDEAQRVGLGAAFTTWGSARAVNMGGPNSPGYVVGNVAIGRSVGGGSTAPSSPVEWSTDVAIVASSGDLGISFGYIRPNAAPPAGASPQGSPFFTIWHRPGATGPWRYIAE